jgi:hypothetical protein
LTLRKENELRGEYLDLRVRKWQEAGEDCIMTSFIIGTFRLILLGSSNQGKLNWQSMYHATHLRETGNA